MSDRFRRRQDALARIIELPMPADGRLRRRGLRRRDRQDGIDPTDTVGFWVTGQPLDG